MANNTEKPITAHGKALRSAQAESADFKTGHFIMVIFGGTGDLSQRKLLPTLFHLYRDGGLPEKFNIAGIGSRELTNEGYRDHIGSGIRQFDAENYDEHSFREFSKNLNYLRGSLIEDDIYEDLCGYLADLEKRSPQKDSNILFYLAVPPGLLPEVITRLKKSRVCELSPRVKVIIEKPFGRDRETASDLNRTISKVFKEKQIYRIDHYLGKETVQNIIFFRFGNSLLEPMWNRQYVDHIQITVAESIGIGHRGAFYEQVGVIRDIVQSHIMQLIALVAMEPPPGFEADLIRNEKTKIFRAIRPFDDKHVDNFTVKGQYGPGYIDGNPVRGFREEDKVSPDSQVPTFFAGKFYIDNWRWAGVPFYVRTGKRLPRKVTEIYIQYKQPPLTLFGGTSAAIEPNGIILGIQPNEQISQELNVKYPGIGNKPHPIFMEFNYAEGFQLREHPAYERLIVDCIKGDLTLFAREDGIELTWSIVDPIVKRWEGEHPMQFPNYAAGSWGPRQADELIEADGRRWRER
jgi:glucose-6-phosphate 1-dehydrogenase